MRERNHETTQAEIEQVQSAFITDQGMYPSPTHTQSVLNTNGGNITHAIQIFSEGLLVFSGSTMGERIYNEVETDHARGQRAAQSWLNFQAPKPPSESPAPDPGATYATALGNALIGYGLSPDQAAQAIVKSSGLA